MLKTCTQMLSKRTWTLSCLSCKTRIHSLWQSWVHSGGGLILGFIWWSFACSWRIEYTDFYFFCFLFLLCLDTLALVSRSVFSHHIECYLLVIQHLLKTIFIQVLFAHRIVGVGYHQRFIHAHGLYKAWCHISEVLHT